MPSTVNGVGTHYYGSKNVKTRTGTCRRCHSETTLKSYDTRLFVVVLFIPVFPLGRKRIVDWCARCTGHFAVDAHQWEVAGQLNASDALQQFANDPSAETAVSCHGQLLSFLQYDEAKILREKILSQMPNDGALRADLAAQLHVTSQFTEALELFDAALALRPDLPAARAGKSHYLIGQGKLDDARETLEFLMEPGAGQMCDMGPLLVLMEQFQIKRRPEDALALAEHLLQELPPLKDDFAFRKIVQKAERAAGRSQSLLPPQDRSLFKLFFSKSREYSPAQRGWAWAGVIAAGVLLALALHNESIRRQRTVYVINRTGAPAQVRIGDAPAVQVDRDATLRVGEGRHEVQITEPIESTETLEIGSDYFDRWFKRPVWIVNVNGEAILGEARLTYARHPTPAQTSILAGRTLLSYSDVDYLFDEEPPRSISVKGEHSVTKVQLEVLDIPLKDAVAALVRRDRPTAMTLAERRLARQADEQLLETYSRAAREPGGDRERAAKFLESQLDRRPVDIEWHRAYQETLDAPATYAELTRRYATLVEREPESAPAWYLFARIDEDVARRDRSLDRALELDPRLGWAVVSHASRKFSVGEFAEAEAPYATALELRPDKINWKLGAILNLLARHKYDAVDQICESIPAEMADVATFVRAWTKIRREMPLDVPAFLAETMPGVSATEAVKARPMLAAQLYYAARDWEQLRALFKDPALAQFPPADKAYYLLSEMPVSELEAAIASPSPTTEGIDALAVAVAYSLGQAERDAGTWNDFAITNLRNGDLGNRQTAALLTGEAPPTIEAFRRTNIRSIDRPIVCVALARRFPDDRARFLAEARVWNLYPIKHYWLIERALTQP